MTQTRIVVDGLTKSLIFPDGRLTRVLAGVSLSARGGEVVCLFGRSGCGKSTLLRVLAGVWTPDVESTDGRPVRTVVPSGDDVCAWMPQRCALVKSKSVWNNVLVAARSRDRAGAADRVGEALEFVELTKWKDAHPAELSGGMQQRVALARVLAVRPRIFLLDEPLTSLDLSLRKRISQRLRDYARQNDVAMLVTTHTVEESVDFGTRIYIIGGKPGSVRFRISMADGAPIDDVEDPHVSKIVCSSRPEMLASVYTALETSENMVEQ